MEFFETQMPFQMSINSVITLKINVTVLERTAIEISSKFSASNTAKYQAWFLEETLVFNIICTNFSSDDKHLALSHRSDKTLL